MRCLCGIVVVSACSRLLLFRAAANCAATNVHSTTTTTTTTRVRILTLSTFINLHHFFPLLSLSVHSLALIHHSNPLPENVFTPLALALTSTASMETGA